MAWAGLVQVVAPTIVVMGPSVIGSMPLGLRATLLERGHWTEVRAALEERDLDASILLEGLRPIEWLPLRAHVALVEVTADVLGLDGVRALGFIRTQESTMGGLFPSVLRSWVRSFRDDPASLVRIGPRLWQMAFRDAGEFVIDRVDASGADARVLHLASLAASPAWRQLLEGASAGILQLAGLGRRVTVSSDGATTTRVRFDWTGTSTT